MIENDTFTLGGHTFSSRFILGSGKYNLDLIRAAVSDAGAQIITLAVRRANNKDSENILDYIPEGVTLLPNTSGARMPTRLSALRALHGKWAAVILSKSKLCTTLNTCFLTTTKRLRQLKFLQRKALSLCRICTLT